MELNKTILLNGQKHTVLDKRKEECEDHYGKPFIEISYLIRNEVSGRTSWLTENVVFAMTPEAYFGKAVSSISQAILQLQTSGVDVSKFISELSDIRREISYSLDTDE